MSTRRLLPLLLLALLARPAHAYIDPGAGSLLLQLIIAGMTGAFVTLKLYWSRFRGRGRKTPDEKPGE